MKPQWTIVMALVTRVIYFYIYDKKHTCSIILKCLLEEMVLVI